MLVVGMGNSDARKQDLIDFRNTHGDLFFPQNIGIQFPNTNICWLVIFHIFPYFSIYWE